MFSAAFDFSGRGDGNVGWMQVADWETPGLCLQHFYVEFICEKIDIWLFKRVYIWIQSGTCCLKKEITGINICIIVDHCVYLFVTF